MSKEAQKRKFDSFLRDFVDGASSVYKMAWEQVLLLSVYTRQQLMEKNDDYNFTESKINFENKLRLMELLFTRPEEDVTKEYEKLRGDIMDRIESYHDIHHVTNYLSEIINNNIEDKELSKLANSILNEISRRHISFTSKDGLHKHHYSYYSMYRSLTESLLVFRKILELDFSEENIHKYLFSDIRYQFNVDRLYMDTNKDSDFYQFKKSLSDAKDIHDALSVMEKYNDVIDMDDILSKAGSALSKDIGRKTSEIFNVFQKVVVTKGEFSKTPVSPFEQMVSTRNESDAKENYIVLRINQNTLETCISLNKLDDVMDAIKRSITDNSTPREKFSHPIGDRESLLNIADWYQQVKTDLFSKITDCPSLLASILDFDFRHRIGIFNERYGIIKVPFRKNTWFSKDGYLLVTGLIQIFLFKSVDLPKSRDNFFDVKNSSYIKYNETDSYIENLKKYLNFDICLNLDMANVRILSDQLMKDWARLNFDENLSEELPDYKAMINRFKRLPIYLRPIENVVDKKDSNQENGLKKPHKNRKSRVWCTSVLIVNQKNKSGKERYPIDSSFPLPLWTNIDFHHL